MEEGNFPSAPTHAVPAAVQSACLAKPADETEDERQQSTKVLKAFDTTISTATPVIHNAAHCAAHTTPPPPVPLSANSNKQAAYPTIALGHTLQSNESATNAHAFVVPLRSYETSLNFISSTPPLTTATGLMALKDVDHPDDTSDVGAVDDTIELELEQLFDDFDDGCDANLAEPGDSLDTNGERGQDDDVQGRNIFENPTTPEDPVNTLHKVISHEPRVLINNRSGSTSDLHPHPNRPASCFYNGTTCYCVMHVIRHFHQVQYCMLTKPAKFYVCSTSSFISDIDSSSAPVMEVHL